MDDHGIFAYASTQGTEAAFGAAALLMDPSLTHHGRAGRTGFDRPTYIYPSRLVGATTDEMQRLVGRLVNERAELRIQLRRALGIESATSTSDGIPGSWRGRIVPFSETLRQEMDCSHGLIVTDPLYSRQQRYQLVIPVLNLSEFESAGMDVIADEKEWLPLVSGDSGAVAFAVEMIQTVFHPTEIGDGTPAVVDGDTAARIDARIVELFEL